MHWLPQCATQPQSGRILYRNQAIPVAMLNSILGLSKSFVKVKSFDMLWDADTQGLFVSFLFNLYRIKPQQWLQYQLEHDIISQLLYISDRYRESPILQNIFSSENTDSDLLFNVNRLYDSLFVILVSASYALRDKLHFESMKGNEHIIVFGDRLFPITNSEHQIKLFKEIQIFYGKCRRINNKNLQCHNKRCRKTERKSKYCCSRCRVAIYCSRRCQKLDWNRGKHKEQCKAYVAARNAAESFTPTEKQFRCTCGCTCGR